MSLLAQRLLMASGGKKDSTYIEDVFSTYLYRGNDNYINVTNGVKLSNANAGNSLDFDGATDGDALTVADFPNFLTDNFTVECWIYPHTVSGGIDTIMDTYQNSSSSGAWWALHQNDDGFYWGRNSANPIATSGNLQANQWYHVAMVRNGTNFTLYLNGSSISTYTESYDYSDGGAETRTLSIGRQHNPGSGRQFDGSISNVRITIGQAIYTSNFTPSTEALTTTSQGATASNVKLLCCQSSTSPTAAAKSPSGITEIGTVEPQLFGPFTGTDGKDGLVWIKNRDTSGYLHALFDTERGTTKTISTNLTNTEFTEAKGVTSFNNSGFTIGGIGGDLAFNKVNIDYASWTFAKQKGFFDIVTYTGNNTARTIPHDLGCVPGFIIVKATNRTSDWICWHTGLGDTDGIVLNSTSAKSTPPWNATYWNNTNPTATHFSIGTNADVNHGDSGTEGTYVAYLFAGDNATRWSDMLSPASGTFDYPATLAFNGLLQSNPNRLRTSGNHILVTMTISPAITVQAGQSVVIYGEDAAIGNPYNYSGTATVTIDGATYTSNSGDTHTFNYSGQLTQITYQTNSTGGRTYLEGIRVNGDLLTDGSFFVDGNPNYTAGEESKFGEDADQSIIKCGRYVGKSGANTVNLGWEPQWVMVKNIDSSEPWVMMDSMRGWVNASSGAISLRANSNGNESAYGPWGPTATGWELDLNQREIDQNEQNYIYIAIRRPDGYVSKPAEEGTDVFTMNAPTGSHSTPEFISNFPVDYGIYRKTTGSQNWFNSARLIEPNELKTDVDDEESAWANGISFDYNNGWGTSGQYTPIGTYQSWMWQRGQGMDVVTYKGNSVQGHDIPHSLGVAPNMMWVKNRTRTTGGGADWQVYVSGITYLSVYGSDPDNYGNNPAVLQLNSTNQAQFSSSGVWDHTHPTSTVFRVGDTFSTNQSGESMIAMLFADVDGISKVGNYTGTTSNNPIDLGFTPRFLMIKRVDAAGDWLIFDTLRGIASAVSGNAEQIYTHELSTQQTYSWTCPAGVTSVSVVAVGAGGGGIGAGNGQNYGIGGGGGGLGYKNNISVTAGQSYTVKVGARGQAGPSPGTSPTGPAPNDGDSYFIDASTVRGGGGEGGYSSSNGGRGGDYTGDGGGNGGRGGPSVNSGGNKGGGGGAGGYAGNGGDGMNAGGNGGTGTDGSGGAGGGSFGGGGGVGLLGQGSSAAFSWNNGSGGSGGDDGLGYAQGGNGGNYGGGGGCVDNNRSNGSYGGQGAVRIIWNTAGHARSFPNTNVSTFEDKVLKLNESDAQFDQDCLSTTSSGMTLTGADSLVNVNGGKYIYYAHA